MGRGFLNPSHNEQERSLLEEGIEGSTDPQINPYMISNVGRLPSSFTTHKCAGASDTLHIY